MELTPKDLQEIADAVGAKVGYDANALVAAVAQAVVPVILTEVDKMFLKQYGLLSTLRTPTPEGWTNYTTANNRAKATVASAQHDFAKLAVLDATYAIIAAEDYDNSLLMLYLVDHDGGTVSQSYSTGIDTGEFTLAPVSSSMALLSYYYPASNLIRIQTVTRSGSTLSLGTAATLHATGGQFISLAVHSSTDFTAFFVDTDGDLQARYGTIAGTSITFPGAAQELRSSNTGVTAACHNTAARAVVTFVDDSDYGSITQIATTANTSTGAITYGAEAVVLNSSAGNFGGYFPQVVKVADDKVVCAYNDYNDPVTLRLKAIPLGGMTDGAKPKVATSTIATNTITAGTPKTVATEWWEDIALVPMTTYGQVLMTGTRLLDGQPTSQLAVIDASGSAPIIRSQQQTETDGAIGADLGRISDSAVLHVFSDTGASRALKLRRLVND